jgi:hypothetical protein
MCSLRHTYWTRLEFHDINTIFHENLFISPEWPEL